VIDDIGIAIEYYDITDETNREVLMKIGGKQQVPFLIDDKGDRGKMTMYESDDIIEYLKHNYADWE